jgi:hypothetical protein
LLDRYLAKTGYDSQQTSNPVQSGRPDNLDTPLDDTSGVDHAADGVFTDQTVAHDPQPWLSRHRGIVSASSAVAAATGVLGAATRRRRT